ncbi:MAG: type II toxin-antitoxin system HicB family antitoxin [Deltaproteobacteria bacterium]|jgi:predicted HicB family RNase H-like nuclease|nr:type II toxin-antitoxin system HicB family antitoxin [Deltaproteobacteria bacterium]
MNNAITYKGYTAIVGFSAEDDCLVGHLAGINDVIGFHADSVEEIRKVFHETVDDYLATCAKIGRAPNKPYSGKVTLRLPPELHAQLAVQAEANGSSLNNWMVAALNRVVEQHA